MAPVIPFFIFHSICLFFVFVVVVGMIEIVCLRVYIRSQRILLIWLIQLKNLLSPSLKKCDCSLKECYCGCVPGWPGRATLCEASYRTACIDVVLAHRLTNTDRNVAHSESPKNLGKKEHSNGSCVSS